MDRSSNRDLMSEKNYMVLAGISSASKTTDGPRVSLLGDHTTRKDDKGDQTSNRETIWINTGGSRSGRGEHETRWHVEAFAQPRDATATYT